MEIFTVAVGAHGLQGAQRRHQGMVDPPNARGNRLEVDIRHLGLACDLVSRGLRNNTELGLGKREGGFEVEPLLHPVFIIEDRAECVGAPHMLEKNGIEDTGGHADYSPY